MKLNRRLLRKMILSEIKILKEGKKIKDVVEESKRKPKEIFYYFMEEDNLVHVIKNGVIDETITDVEIGNKKYNTYSLGKVPVGPGNLFARKTAKVYNFPT